MKALQFYTIILLTLIVLGHLFGESNEVRFFTQINFSAGYWISYLYNHSRKEK